MYQVTGNPNMKAETGRGWEVGMKYGNSRRGFNVAFYDNYYRNYIDMIGINPCSGTKMCFGYDNLFHVSYALSSVAPFRGIIGFGYKTDN